jgi:hypothetical protein
MNADLKQLLSFLFPWYSAIQSTVYKRTAFIPINYELYISGTIVLHIKYMLTSGCRSLLEKINGCCSCGGIVLYDLRTVTPISRRSVHSGGL